MMEKIIHDYKQFMRIDAFPEFEIEYYSLDNTTEYIYAAQAIYNFKTKEHILHLPEGINIPRFLLFHELTHILDADEYSIGDKNHDLCLHGFMEYHASQVELLDMIGAVTVNSTLSFSMNDPLNGSDWSLKQYVDNKLETARNLIIDSDRQKRVDGLGVLYNFLGLRSVCCMFAEDYNDQYDYHEFLEIIPSYLFSTMSNFMIGWIIDIEKAVGLYSNVLNAVVRF